MNTKVKSFVERSEVTSHPTTSEVNATQSAKWSDTYPMRSKVECNDITSDDERSEVTSHTTTSEVNATQTVKWSDIHPMTSKVKWSEITSDDEQSEVASHTTTSEVNATQIVKWSDTHPTTSEVEWTDITSSDGERSEVTSHTTTSEGNATQTVKWSDTHPTTSEVKWSDIISGDQRIEVNATQTMEPQNPQLDEASDEISSVKGTSTLVAGSTSKETLPKGLQSSQEVKYAVIREVYGDEVKNLRSDGDLYYQNSEVVRGVWKIMSFDHGHPSWVFVPLQSYDQSNQYHMDGLIGSTRNSLFDELKGNVWKHSQSVDGCLKVQHAFIKCSPDQRSILAKELHGHVWKALNCPQANYVLQACIGFCRPSDFQFVIDEIFGKGGALVVATGRNGCRIICRLIEYANIEQMRQMKKDLLFNTVELSTDTFGNYVIQHLLEHSCDESIPSDIIEQLVAHLPNMKANSFSCHFGAVLEKALFTSAEKRTHLANAVVSDYASLITMACTRWGTNGAAQAFYLAGESYQEAAREQLMKMQFQNMLSHNKQKRRYGIKLLDLVERRTNAVKQIPPKASWKSELISKLPADSKMHTMTKIR